MNLLPEDIEKRRSKKPKKKAIAEKE